MVEPRNPENIFLQKHVALLEALYRLYERIVGYHGQLTAFFGRLRDGAYIQATVESMLLVRLSRIPSPSPCDWAKKTPTLPSSLCLLPARRRQPPATSISWDLLNTALKTGLLREALQPSNAQGPEGKQLMVEAVALLGALLLLLDRRIPGPARERSVVAYFRARGGAQVNYCTRLAPLRSCATAQQHADICTCGCCVDH